MMSYESIKKEANGICMEYGKCTCEQHVEVYIWRIWVVNSKTYKIKSTENKYWIILFVLNIWCCFMPQCNLLREDLP